MWFESHFATENTANKFLGRSPGDETVKGSRTGGSREEAWNILMSSRGPGRLMQRVPGWTLGSLGLAGLAAPPCLFFLQPGGGGGDGGGEMGV